MSYAEIRMRRALTALVVAACGSVEATPAPLPSPTAAAVTAVDAGPAACPTAGPIASTPPLSGAAIREPSGLVASALNRGIFWTHNDSGDSARAFAVNESGALVATLAFDTAPPVDIEDMAVEDAGPDSYLYFADIGDNAVNRTEYVIHRVREPRLGAESILTATSEKMTVRYADGPHDAETLLFDPITKDLFVATKVVFGSSAIHRVGPFAANTAVTTTRVASVPVALATGGAISRDGTRVALRNYGASAWLWRRAPGEDLAAALAHTACRLPLASETQGEAFAFLADDAGYATLSEGAGEALHLARFE